jgi:two-component system response regulator EvgA
MHRAIIVDDHPFIRSAVKVLLTQMNIEVVAEADSGSQALQLVREHSPDLVILDLIMPRLDGLDVISRLRALNTSTRILVLTGQAPVIYAHRCQRAGADGYVSKSSELETLSQAVQCVLEGNSWFTPTSSDPVFNLYPPITDALLLKRLSNRELSILQQLAQGRTNKGISSEMLLSAKTVSTYRSRLLAKLELQSVVQLASFAKRNYLC